MEKMVAKVQVSFCCQGLLISLKTKRRKLLAYAWDTCTIFRTVKLVGK